MTRVASPILRPLSKPTARVGPPPLVTAFCRGWLTAVCVTLMGYALFGRGFAYIGVPPLFVAELLTISGIGVLLVCGAWWPLLRMPQVISLILMCAWCAMRTIPMIGPYGMDALRDAVFWAYAVFAFAVAAVLITQPKLFPIAVRRYRLFFKVFLLATPFLWMIFETYGDKFGATVGGTLPVWPWAPDVPILFLKAGDLQVHLGGVLGYWASEVAGAVSIWWFLPLFINVAMLGPVNRSGLMAFLGSLAVSLILKPKNRWAWTFVLIAVGGLSLLFVTGLSFEIPGTDRPISADQLIENVVSIAGKDSGDMNDELQGTKQWRLDFWHAIIQDTIYGPAFWTGHGFGVNLTEQYGFEVDPDHAVRAPHSCHMTMLARAGVPGLFLWIVTQLSWAAGMLDGYIRSTAARRKQWAGVFMWLFIYWLMLIINGSFDPYLEGPVGGVWLWCIYGAGLAAMFLRKSQPTLFDLPPSESENQSDALAEMGTL